VILNVTRSHKRTKDVTRRVFENPSAFGGPGFAGELERSPDPLAAIRAGVLLLGRKKVRESERKWEEKGKGRERGRRGKGRKRGGIV